MFIIVHNSLMLVHGHMQVNKVLFQWFFLITELFISCSSFVKPQGFMNPSLGNPIYHLYVNLLHKLINK